MLQAAEQKNTFRLTSFNSTNLHKWQLPQFAFVPREMETLRTSPEPGQERFVYNGHGDINVDAAGRLVISVQALNARGDLARKQLMQSLLADDVELDARVDLEQVIDCLIETTSLADGKPDSDFRELHTRVLNHFRQLLQKFERFASYDAEL
ncbi:hypothetical protein QTI51_37205 [Variovorax sp. J22G73]|nr:hypothetical protein [Variovorax sp. J22R203]MDM0010173.1 hypothetical protein [Variovorax sp. J22R203]MDM0102965.1 hypothetical protein [Variovorax sp. J22G73]